MKLQLRYKLIGLHQGKVAYQKAGKFKHLGPFCFYLHLPVSYFFRNLRGRLEGEGLAEACHQFLGAGWENVCESGCFFQGKSEFPS